MKQKYLKYQISAITVITLLFSEFVTAQKAVLDTNMIKIGDKVNLTLSIQVQNKKNVYFPLFDKEIISGIEILEQSDIIEKNEGKTLEKIYILTGFNDSTYKIPPFKIIKNGDTVLTNSLVLDISNPTPDSAYLAKIDTTQIIKIADIKEPMNTPLTFKEFWARFGKYILIGIGLIIISITLFYLYRRYKQNKPIFAKPETVIPPHVWAVENLNRIKNSNLISESKIKEYYTELISIIKIYIEKRYGFPAPEYTSTDLINFMQTSNIIEKEEIQSLHKILFYADYAKFAEAKHSGSENILNLTEAYNFVDKTKQTETQQPIT